MDQLLSEFRQDLVSGEWVLISGGRKHSIRKFEHSYQSKEGCPFEDPSESGQEIVWSYPNDRDWQIMAIKNKFPAVKSGLCGPAALRGPSLIHDAVGVHEVIIFRDHDLHFSDFSQDQGVSAIRVYKKRYQEIEKESGCIQYIMIFHNFGSGAGASIYHPHSQIISTPILPPHVSRSLIGSHNFYQKNRKRVYDVIIEWEKQENKRIIYENDLFMAFCPFVSRYPYEIRIFSRDSHAHFERMPDEFDKYLADAMTAVLRKIKKALDNPPYNFFIHTAPVETALENIHEFYSWHVEIVPKLSISGGFELGTGVDVNVVDPDLAAEELRNA